MKTYSLFLTFCLIALANERPELWWVIVVAAMIQIVVWALTGDLSAFFRKLFKRTPKGGDDFEFDKGKEESIVDKEEDRKTLLKFLNKLEPGCLRKRNSLDFDTEAARIIREEYSWVLEACVRAIPGWIFDTTAEITTGREEEMEAIYHNNLRTIGGLINTELQRREGEVYRPGTGGVAVGG